MADPTIKTENKFFLTREHDNGINEDRIYLRSHLPRTLTLEDARALAADLLTLAGPAPSTTPEPPPAPVVAYLEPAPEPPAEVPAIESALVDENVAPPVIQ